MTRREVREALALGQFKAAIVATGSIEQHLEHLALENDIASSTFMAERVAERLYPQVLVTAPVSIGIAEHHMHSAGTLTAKPGTWLAVMFDAVESLVRHGVKNVLMLNGHVKNSAITKAALPQWQQFLEREHGGVDIRFHSYWEVLNEQFVNSVQKTPGFPAHAKEFETSITMHIRPENVRVDAFPYSEDAGVSASTAETGRKLTDKIVDGVELMVKEMLAK